ncbi:hypothetical protein ACFQX6_59400 [Streptosporangium lutulentum]
MVLLGLAFSLAYGPLTMAAVEDVDEHEHGLAAACCTPRSSSASPSACQR